MRRIYFLTPEDSGLQQGHFGFKAGILDPRDPASKKQAAGAKPSEVLGPEATDGGGSPRWPAPCSAAAGRRESRSLERAVGARGQRWPSRWTMGSANVNEASPGGGTDVSTLVFSNGGYEDFPLERNKGKSEGWRWVIGGAVSGRRRRCSLSTPSKSFPPS